MIDLIMKILLIDDPGNIVDTLAVNRQPGIARFCKNPRDLFFLRIFGNSGNIDPGRQNINRLLLGKFNRATDQAALLLVDAALLLRLLHNRQQLFFGDGAVFLGFEKAENSIFQSRNSRLTGVSRIRRKLMIGAENMANRSGDSFAMLLGEISPKIKHDHGGDQPLEMPGPASPPSSRTNSTVASEALAIFTILLPMRMVESRRVIAFGKLQDASAARRFFTLFRHIFQLDAVQRGKCRLCCREISRHDDAENDDKKRHSLGLHESSFLFF